MSMFYSSSKTSLSNMKFEIICIFNVHDADCPHDICFICCKTLYCDITLYWFHKMHFLNNIFFN